MSSQKYQVLLFILILNSLSIIWFMSQLASANSMASNNNLFKLSPTDTSYDSEDKVNLSLYYESLCPYCANFIVNHLVKIFQTDLITIVNLRLVPWGNTQISSNRSWICQHGVDECELDVAEACAINSWPRPEMHFRFIYCIERLHLMNKHSEWQSCFGATGLDSKPLQNCYNTGIGYQLEKAYADETARLNPRHRFVPWVVVNGLPLQDDYQNFISYICKAYRGYRIPTACRTGASDINMSGATIPAEVCTKEDIKA